MEKYTLGFQEIKSNMLEVVGGKGLNLGNLTNIHGIAVPDGFCITTYAYKKSVENIVEFTILIDSLTKADLNDMEQISNISSNLRSIIENINLSKDIEYEIYGRLAGFEMNQAYAIRSSATAEDLEYASFAGQQDTYLNIKGKDEVMRYVLKCWASLYTDRAVIYRIQNGIDQKNVQLSVVIQKMVIPQASGVMFTADPVTSDRKTMIVDASFGLGDALVSGLVSPDSFKIKDYKITAKQINTKLIEILPCEKGGTKDKKINANRQKTQALSDAEVLSLCEIGKRIEKYFGCPQDIEWCYMNSTFYIVQSRPITTLFPPPISRDGKKRVYISSAHLQVMTDPILPLGMSIFELSSLYPLDRAGGRIFVDITHDLKSIRGRRIVRNKVEILDPFMWNVIKKLMASKDFIKKLPKGKANLLSGVNFSKRLKEAIRIYRKNDPQIVDNMIKSHRNELSQIEIEIGKLSGAEIFDFIINDKKQLLKAIFDEIGFGAILASFFAKAWLNKNIEKWLGEKSITDILSKSVDHNITSEMGHAFCSIADKIRINPEVRKYFDQELEGELLSNLSKLEGGLEVISALSDFLDKYGMRCTGEIDITKARWFEKPEQLIPVINSNLKLLKPGEHIEKFEQGKKEAEAKEDEILSRLSKLPGGRKKVEKTRKMISIFRNFLGTREYPKYFLVCRYAIYKRALLKEANKLFADKIIKAVNDVYFLYIDEFREAVRTKQVDYSLIEERKREYLHYKRLTPPRIIMSDGEVPYCDFKGKSFPEGALVGVPVSTGCIEGRARIVDKLENARVEQGDILVTSFTDPSWTPVFIYISGLVTEVGGIMSHGAVITREYGLPAVAGVENATRLIKDGQRIRLNGSEGYIEILE